MLCPFLGEPRPCGVDETSKAADIKALLKARGAGGGGGRGAGASPTVQATNPLQAR